jgi:hypothetical protein
MVQRRRSTARVPMFPSMAAVAAAVDPDATRSALDDNGADDIVVKCTSGVDHSDGESRHPS